MTNTLQIGQIAPNGLALNIAGEQVELTTLWQDKPLVLTFLRHFGWIHCREWLAQLESHQAEFSAENLNVVAIGLGQPKHAKRFCGKLAPSVECLTNEKPDLNFEYGLTRGGVFQLASLDGIRNGVRAARSGFKQGQSTGDVRMLPGTFVIDTDGRILFAHYSQNAGDHPDIPQMLRQLPARV